MKRLLSLLLCGLLFASSFAQNALHFDGTNDQMNCGTDSAYNVGGTAFTVEAWIKASSWKTNIYDGSIVLKENNNNNGGWMLRAGNGGRLGCGIGDGMNSAWTEINTTSSILNLNTWYHVAMSYDGSYLRLYKDGQIVDSVSASFSVRINTLTPLTVGYHPTYGRNWNGAIDEIRIWNRTLTKAELNQNKSDEFCSTPSSDLRAYYKFSEGNANANNTSISSIVDYSQFQNDAMLSSFNMYGSSSNIIAGANLNRDSTHSYDTLNRCVGFYYPPTKTFYNSSGSYQHRIASAMGCDSILNIEVILKGNSSIQIDTAVCDSFIGPNNQVYKKSRSIVVVLTNSVGCDSIINIDLTVGADSGFVDTTVCDLYLSPLGKTITVTGIYYDTLTSQNHCDSIVQLDVTVNSSSIEQQAGYICDSVLAPSGNMWYHLPGVYLDTLAGQLGCDSIIEMSLSLAVTTADLNADVCNNFVSPSGKTWTNTGSYMDTLNNHLNCDSIISIDLIVRKSSESSTQIKACDSLRSVSGKFLYTADGTYVDTLVNKAGCDSFVTMEVDITVAEANIFLVDDYTLLSDSADAYQWLNCDSTYKAIEGQNDFIFQYPHRGSFAVEITENGCLDTSTCLTIAGLGLEELKTPKTYLYPNPSSGQFKIQRESKASFDLQIMNVFGQTVLKLDKVNSNETIDIGSLPSGLYIIVLDNGVSPRLILNKT